MKIGKFHRLLGLALLLPLVLSAITGLAYRLGRTWFGISKEAGNRIMELHDGSILGGTFSNIYVTVSGLGLLALVGTGFYFICRRRAKVPQWKWHRITGIVMMLPLAVTAVTGILYKLGKEWFGLSEATLKLVMSLHQGSWLGPQVRVYYILVIGLGLLSLTITGLQISRIFGKKSTKKS